MPTNSPLMDMPVPNIGPTGDTGPAWATYLNQCLSILDSHTHVTGNGAQIPTNGININADLNFNLTNTIGVRSYRCATNSATLAGSSDKGCIYNVSGDLYWNNGSGTAVRLTNGTGINISGVAGFYGDYAQPGVPAAATYSNTTKTFTFTQDSGKTAIIAAGTYQLYETGAVGANPINLKSPTALGASYDVILPTTAASTNSVMRFDNTGQAKFISVLGTSGQITVTQNANDITLSTPTIISSTWTPVSSAGVNVGVAFSTTASYYMRVNNVVTFNLCISVINIPANGAWSFLVTLPIAKTTGTYAAGDFLCDHNFRSNGFVNNVGVSVGSATNFTVNGNVSSGAPVSLTNMTITCTYSIA